MIRWTQLSVFVLLYHSCAFFTIPGDRQPGSVSICCVVEIQMGRVTEKKEKLMRNKLRYFKLMFKKSRKLTKALRLLSVHYSGISVPFQIL